MAKARSTSRRPPKPPPSPWDRRKGESDAEWAAFLAFRDAGPKRTLGGAYRAAHPEEAAAQGGHAFLWDRTARKHAWEARVAAYDAFVDRERVKGVAKAMREEGEQWALRGKDVREEAYRVGRELLRRSLELAQMPVREKTVVNDRTGEVTVWKPLSAADARTAAGLYRAAVTTLAEVCQAGLAAVPPHLRRLNDVTAGNGDPADPRTAQLDEIGRILTSVKEAAEKGHLPAVEVYLKLTAQRDKILGIDEPPGAPPGGGVARGPIFIEVVRPGPGGAPGPGVVIDITPEPGEEPLDLPDRPAGLDVPRGPDPAG